MKNLRPQNANQWADYFQSNANYEAGVSDDTINCEGDDYNSQFSFSDSLKSINKLKDIINIKPEVRKAWQQNFSLF